MAEYIERKALMKFPIRSDHCDKEHANEHFLNGIETVLEYAAQLTTVDAEVVVRCKDCRKFKTYGCRMVASGYDDFCSYGERKEDAT